MKKRLFIDCGFSGISGDLCIFGLSLNIQADLAVGLCGDRLL